MVCSRCYRWYHLNGANSTERAAAPRSPRRLAPRNCAPATQGGAGRLASAPRPSPPPTLPPAPGRRALELLSQVARLDAVRLVVVQVGARGQLQARARRDLADRRSGAAPVAREGERAGHARGGERAPLRQRPRDRERAARRRTEPLLQPRAASGARRLVLDAARGRLRRASTRRPRQSPRARPRPALRARRRAPACSACARVAAASRTAPSGRRTRPRARPSRPQAAPAPRAPAPRPRARAGAPAPSAARAA